MEDHGKQIIRVFLFMMGITLVCGQLCRNCVSDCDEVTGLCSGNCSLGWDGPTCSRRNAAVQQKTTQSSTYEFYTSSFAVDGRTGHLFFEKRPRCSHTAVTRQSAFWSVTLDAQYNIYLFRIYNRDEYACSGRQCGSRLNGFTLSVGNSSSQSYKVCYQDNTTDPSGPGATIDGVCNSGPVLGNTVRIMINNGQPLSLCEVQIFVCTNGTYGPECEERCGNCAEGPSDCDTTSGHCPQRTPTCLLGYLPPKCDTVCSAGTYGPDCGKKCGNCAEGPLVCDTISGHCPQRTPTCMPGYLPPKCDAVCSNETYGLDCGRKCGNCAEGTSVCDTTSGHCRNGKKICMPGYLPPKCDKDCNPGTYGSDCEMKCGHCLEGESVCDTRVGHCPDGTPRCMAGYSGVTCDTECTNKRWGNDCLEVCGQCYNNVLCNAITGDCPLAKENPRCDIGYSGTHCIALSHLKDSPPDYTGVIAGSAGGLSIVVIVGVIVIVVMIRRNSRNAQTGGAASSGPSSTPAQERGVLSEILDRNQMPEPSSIYNVRDTNSLEDHSYETIRHYANLDCNKQT